MKRILNGIILLLTVSILFSCGKDGNDEVIDENAGGFAMQAVIQRIDDKIEVDVTEAEYADGIYWIVTSDSTAYYNDGGKAIKRSDLAVGDKVEIRYNGQVMMSYPPQVVATSIKILK